MRGSLFPPLASTVDKGHGRIERRTIKLSTDLAGHTTFPHAAVAFWIERRVSGLDGRKATVEVVHGITSRPGSGTESAKAILALVRGHWTIENRIHWVRDVVYDEDRSQVRTGSGPRVMATLRNVAISILRLGKAPSIAKALRWCDRDHRRPLRLVGIA